MRLKANSSLEIHWTLTSYNSGRVSMPPNHCPISRGRKPMAKETEAHLYNWSSDLSKCFGTQNGLVRTGMNTLGQRSWQGLRPVVLQGVNSKQTLNINEYHMFCWAACSTSRIRICACWVSVECWAWRIWKFQFGHVSLMKSSFNAPCRRRKDQGTWVVEVFG